MKRVLMFGYLPPPVFGPSVAYETLLRTEFTKHFDVTFINLSVVENIRELEKFSWKKLGKLAGFFFRELWCLLTHRPDVVCYPISYNRRAFQKDRGLVGLARLFRVPVVLWAHGTGVGRFRDSLPDPRPFDRMLNSARTILVLADCLQGDFAGLLVPVRTITLGIEPQPVPPRTSDGRTVLYLGALVKAKGIFDLLAAMPNLPDARLVVAGEWFKPDEERAAQKLIARLGIADAVQFVGPVHGAAKQKLFGAADVFVFLPHSQTEAFGLTLLEAMQAGLPIVTTRGGARDEMAAGGILVPEASPTEIAAAIGGLLKDPSRRQQLGAAGRQLVAARYTAAAYGQRMIEVLNA